MQADKMLAVQRQKSAAFLRSKSQNGFVGKALIGFSSLLKRQDVMFQPAQRLGNGQGEVLIREQTGHVLRGFVFLDMLFNLIGMQAMVRPCVNQVLGMKIRVTPQQVSFAGTQFSGLHQYPHRDTRAPDTRRPTGNIRVGFDAGNNATQFLDDLLKHLGFLSRRHRTNEFFDSSEGLHFT